MVYHECIKLMETLCADILCDSCWFFAECRRSKLVISHVGLQEGAESKGVPMVVVPVVVAAANKNNNNSSQLDNCA